jgi:hypothetical protein
MGGQADDSALATPTSHLVPAFDGNTLTNERLFGIVLKPGDRVDAVERQSSEHEGAAE